MRLVAVAQLGDDVGGRVPGRQEFRRRAGTLDLPDRAPRQPGRGAEPAFDRAPRDGRAVDPQHIGDERVTDHGPGLDETLDQRLGIVGAGRLPAPAVQPERAPRGVGCGYLLLDSEEDPLVVFAPLKRRAIADDPSFREIVSLAWFEHDRRWRDVVEADR